ncbi:MAG: hypothetical protein JKX88_00785 [Marinicaulis sp.]|nr:hypothetical protein [Marinicaulis sp.]
MILNIDYDEMDLWVDTDKIDFVGTLRIIRRELSAKGDDGAVHHQFLIGVNGAAIKVGKSMDCNQSNFDAVCKLPFDEELEELRSLLISELQKRVKSED